MKIPKQLIVAGRIFKIMFPHIFQERLDVFGHTDFGTGKMYITDKDGGGKDLAEAHLEITFWHEVFHTIDRAYCCNMIGQQSDKEDMIDGLAQGMYQVLHDNKLNQ